LAYISQPGFELEPSSPSAAATSELNWPLLSLTWAHFLNDGAANFLPGVLPAILVALGIDLKLVGTVMAALLVCQALQPVFGWLADRWGGRAFIVVGVVAGATAGALVGLVPNYWSLIVVLVLLGTANAMFHPQALACVRQVTSHGFAFAMSVFLVGGELGRAIWPLLAGLAVTHFGLRALWLLALPAVFTLPLIVGKTPPVRSHTMQERQCARKAKYDKTAMIALLALVAYCTLHAVLLYSLSTFLPLLWSAEGGSLIGGATTVTVLLTVGNLGNLAGGYLADRLGRRFLVGVAAALCAFLLGLFLMGTSPIRWVSLGALGLAAFSTMPVRVLIAQDILPDNHCLGSALALGFSNALGALAVMAFGPIAVRWGIDSVLWLNVILSAISVVAVPLLPEESLEDVILPESDETLENTV
jgi:FSR family fosmidomycin resistance protein-like MFS transporter